MLLDCILLCSSESGNSSSVSSSSKRPRVEQLPAANLDADDPLDEEVIWLYFTILLLPKYYNYFTQAIYLHAKFTYLGV